MGQQHKFCKHCGVRYLYIEPGSITPQHSDVDYCTECKKSIMDTLTKIPRRAEMRFVQSKAFSQEDFYHELKRYEEQGKTPKKWAGECSSNGDQQIIIGIIISGTMYRATWWEKGYDPEFILEEEIYYEYPKPEKK